MEVSNNVRESVKEELYNILTKYIKNDKNKKNKIDNVKEKKNNDENIKNNVDLIENSILEFSKEFAELQGTPMFVEEIYKTKSVDIIYIVKNTDIIKRLDNLSKIAYMSPEELNPEKYEDIIKKREMEEYKKNNKTGSNVFTCAKCKKSKCEVTQKQTRAGDEPPTTFVTCLECGHKFKFG